MAGEKTGGWHQDEEKGGIREEEAAATGREDGEADWPAAGGREGGFVFAVPFL